MNKQTSKVRKSKIEYPRWLSIYYENLRRAHSELKNILFADDFARTTKSFRDKVEAIDDLLYKAEAVAVNEDRKQTKA